MNKLKTILPLAAILALAIPASAFAAPRPKVQFSTGAYAVAENGGSAAITLIRPRNGHSTVRLKYALSVDFSTSDGSAKAGTDYTAVSQPVNFPACSGSPKAGDPCLTQTVNVPVIDNTIVDGARTVNLKLSHATYSGGRAILGYPSNAVLVIADDDSSSTGAGSTFQLATDSQYASEAAVSAPVFVIRSGDLSQAASVNYATSDDSAKAGTDYSATSGTLAFPTQAADPVKSIIQEVDVPLLHNPAIDPQLSDFNFGLSIPGGTGGSLGTPNVENIVVVNSDGAPTLLWSSPSYSVSETAGSVRLTAIAAGSITGDSEVDVDTQTADGTAMSGVNYQSATDTLQFFADDVVESTDVNVLDDGLAGDKAFTDSLVNPTAGAVIGTPGVATVNVLDAGNRSGATGGTTGGAGGTNGSGDQGGNQVVLGAREGACGLTAKATKKQRLLKQKSLKIKLSASKACKVTVATTIKKASTKKRSGKAARALRLKGKTTTLTLQPGKAKTVQVKFTKKTLKAIKKALRARNKLVATVVVSTRDSASKVTKKTLKITIKR